MSTGKGHAVAMQDQLIKLTRAGNVPRYMKDTNAAKAALTGLAVAAARIALREAQAIIGETRPFSGLGLIFSIQALADSLEPTAISSSDQSLSLTPAAIAGLTRSDE